MWSPSPGWPALTLVLDLPKDLQTSQPQEEVPGVCFMPRWVHISVDVEQDKHPEWFSCVGSAQEGDLRVVRFEEV
ncbi:hypothetical protein U0070_005995 [Myodes glareolus]|uniref:Uncharacterized protein n=1 Tax=Myodes glareolus TaxID=447135 RepID=A0AAW0HH20_MYOGA